MQYAWAGLAAMTPATLRPSISPTAVTAEPTRRRRAGLRVVIAVDMRRSSRVVVRSGPVDPDPHLPCEAGRSVPPGRPFRLGKSIDRCRKPSWQPTVSSAA
ncbi:hypothetical protein Val02_53310 [Virgisporangium aliadipatigenens]|uniref:Uncharacterized protein n=1 Tax=Virgisporangium aliadipatigenens TaxID=741659 RepID=A0A8J4DRS3_9ACTN|nr:hypothetical protein Val02_53310 [Virgisporangium aliadipatigenens]